MTQTRCIYMCTDIDYIYTRSLRPISDEMTRNKNEMKFDDMEFRSYGSGHTQITQ